MKQARKLFALALVLGIFSSSLGWAELLKRDDFRDQKRWWSWDNQGSGTEPNIYNGVLYLLIQRASAFGPSGSALWDGKNVWNNCTINIRVKTVTPMRPGTLGWGLWDYVPPWETFDRGESDIAWFMKQYDPYSAIRTWQGAWTRNGDTGNVNFKNLSQVNFGAWHTYTIDRNTGYVDFYVDGNLISQYEDHLPQGLLAFHLWIDNYNYDTNPNVPLVFRAFSQPNALVADYIEIYRGELGTSQPPEGAILLREAPNETGNGDTDYLWKEYAFQSPGGKNLVLITARAESYGDFSDDDDIRIVIDDIDFGWDTALSFNGEELNGENRSLVYVDYFEEGEHFIEIYGDITPILYDVTVIGAVNGDIILDEELNEKAPGGNNYLWKEYSFYCAKDEEVTLFVSASAHENSGDDDDIRIILAGEDFGWDTDNSFSGDQLHGEAKALAIRRYLPGGNHTLRIYADGTPILHNVILYGSEEMNTAPVAHGQAVTTYEETSVGIVLTATDVEGDSLTYTIVAAPAHGSLSGTAPSLTYTPNSNYSGLDSFTFKANDGQADSNVATVSITVGETNDAPVANAQTVTVSEDTVVAISLTATDPDGDVLTYSIVSSPANGNLSGTPPNVTYTPNSNYSGFDSFTFKANDGQADSNVATVSITVTETNKPPVADAQVVTISEDTPGAITLTATDPEGVALNYTIVAPPSSGSLSGAAPNLTYTPNRNYYGSDNFTFKANDGLSDSNTATVSISVTPENDEPVANAQAVTTPEDTAVRITLTATDPDGDALTYSVVSSPVNGSLSGTAPNLTYTPNADYHGPDGFTFKANDGKTDSNVAAVSVTVTKTNEPPVANAQAVTTSEDTQVAITLTATDVDGDALTYSVVGSPVNGSLSGTAPNLTYTPNTNYSGPDSFTFKANDGKADSNVATVMITIAPQNDLPVANDQSVSTLEDTAVAISLTATDPDGDALTYSIVGLPANGSLSGTAPNVIYTPNDDYYGSDSFMFRANDRLNDSNTATVAISVTPQNDPPVANDQSVSTLEDTAVAISLTATDVEGDVLTYSIVSPPANGGLSGAAPDLNYSPDAGFTGTDTFTFQANDGDADSNVATVSIFVESSTPTEQVMHVDSIEITKQTWWILRRGVANVRVVDTDGSPVGGANITGQWSGGANDTDQFTTGADGWAMTYSNWRWGDATFRLCVTNVGRVDWDYDPDSNVITCGSTE
jgi:hypothetical protein